MEEVFDVEGLLGFQAPEKLPVVVLPIAQANENQVRTLPTDRLPLPLEFLPHRGHHALGHPRIPSRQEAVARPVVERMPKPEPDAFEPAEEIEWKLAVFGREGAAVLDRIAALREVTGVRLVAPRERTLHDVYLDSAKGELAAVRVALRLREIEGEVLVALKGFTVSDADGRTRRFEEDAPWDAASVERVLAGLERCGVRLERPASEQPGTSPLESLRRLGLRVLQDRTTRRRTRRLESEGAAIGELALDTVAYSVGERTVTHRELEVEARGSSDEAELASLVRALREIEPALVPWPVDKLALGIALERIGEEELASRVDERGNLDDRGRSCVAAVLRDLSQHRR